VRSRPTFDDLDREPAMIGTPAPELDRLLRSCCRASGLDGASIEDRDGTRKRLYDSDEVAHALERLELTPGEGHCVDSASRGTRVLVADLTDLRERLRPTAFAGGLTLNELAADVVNGRRRMSKETP